MRLDSRYFFLSAFFKSGVCPTPRQSSNVIDFFFSILFYFFFCPGSDNLYQMASQLECVAWNPVNTLASTIKRYVGLPCQPGGK